MKMEEKSSMNRPHIQFREQAMGELSSHAGNSPPMIIHRTVHRKKRKRMRANLKRRRRFTIRKRQKKSSECHPKPIRKEAEKITLPLYPDVVSL